MRKFHCFLTSFAVTCLCLGSVRAECNNSQWQGVFTRDAGGFETSVLTVTDVTCDSLKFKLDTASGAHVGEAQGTAYFVGDKAVYTDPEGAAFILTKSDNEIQLEQNDRMTIYGGVGVFFEGHYIKDAKPLNKEFYFIDRGIFKEVQEKEFKHLVGINYDKFKETAHLVFDNGTDQNIARVFSMGVRGLFTIQESIIAVRDSDNTIWAATLDEDRILYFTNAKDKKVPKSFQEWRGNFKQKAFVLQ